MPDSSLTGKYFFTPAIKRALTIVYVNVALTRREERRFYNFFFGAQAKLTPDDGETRGMCSRMQTAHVCVKSDDDEDEDG